MDVHARKGGDDAGVGLHRWKGVYKPRDVERRDQSSQRDQFSQCDKYKIMKSQCSVSGRVSKRDLENEEIQVYLSKLKELVPFMPKNRKLSKLEVIQYVIDYICDLQDALEGPGLQAVIRGSPGHSPIRQPLGVLAPNTLVTPTSCSTQEATSVPAFIEKPSPPDTRPVSV
ncbi:uncharacterized protein LOC106665992 [Cimex lectularius]|uniref:BHLH domain-containing protein n=1 Tax=Cimex lectularius TaxID=79782 RepID=A0A8I6RKW9_CIMLE|nr:uncharacterized protein LOC106665992 [Cimex lectularius]